MLQTQNESHCVPCPSTPVNQEAPRDYINEGEQLFSQGLMDEARVLFLEATEICPGNAPAWNNLAVIALLEGHDVEAEKLLRQAIEVQGDYLDAYHNLAAIYVQRGNLKRAARELGRVLEFKPADIPTLKLLSKIYMDLGQPDKAHQLLDQFQGLGAMKSFIDSLWLGIKYCAMADNLSPRDKLEKFTAAVLKYLDGQDGRSPRYKLVVTDQETGHEVVLEDFYSTFYYKENPSFVAQGNLDANDKSCLVLTIGEHSDWDFFRKTLRTEMKAEGGCLGDFTQTRKVMKRESHLIKYNLESTLKYFRDNVGPCDCHALRAVLV